MAVANKLVVNDCIPKNSYFVDPISGSGNALLSGMMEVTISPLNFKVKHAN